MTMQTPSDLSGPAITGAVNATPGAAPMFPSAATPQTAYQAGLQGLGASPQAVTNANPGVGGGAASGPIGAPAPVAGPSAGQKTATTGAAAGQRIGGQLSGQATGAEDGLMRYDGPALNTPPSPAASFAQGYQTTLQQSPQYQQMMAGPQVKP